MYTLRTVPMSRQRGGITTAYLVFLDGRFFRSFHTLVQAERFMKGVTR